MNSNVPIIAQLQNSRVGRRAVMAETPFEFVRASPD